MSFLYPSSPDKTPADVFGGEGFGGVVYKATDISLTASGQQNIMLLSAGRGKFIWQYFVVVSTTVTGFSAPASITAGWTGTPVQIIPSPSALGITVADRFLLFQPSGGTVVIPDATQIVLDVTTAATATVFDVSVYLIGHHV